MLDKFDYGFNRAIDEIIGGILTSIIVSVFVSTGLIPSSFIWCFQLLNVFGTIILIQKMRYWATSYIFGWLIGVIILTYSGLLAIIDILIYFIPLLVFLVYRLYKWTHE